MPAVRARETVVAEAEWMLGHGCNGWDVVRLLGMKPDTIWRSLTRAGRKDLAAHFTPTALDERHVPPWRATA